MSKYKVGDKFIVEVREIFDKKFPQTAKELYQLDCFDKTLVEEDELDRLQEVNPKLKIEDIDDMLAEHDLKKESYEKGLQDAWKLYMMCLEMPRNEFCKILGIKNCTLGELFESIEPQEALAKIEAYEKSQQIQVDDVVIDNEGDVYVVTHIYDNKYFEGIDKEGCVCGGVCIDTCTKTGQTISISHLLKQIRGNE